MGKLVSTTYAGALFDLAIEKDRALEWQKEIEAVKAILEENPDFGKLMLHPRIPREDKLSLAAEAFEGRVDPEIAGFIRMIIEKDRYGEIEGIFDAFIADVKAHNGIGTAYVTTAVQLKDAHKEELKSKLLETTRYEEMEIFYSVDETLIGGMIIRLGDRVLDSSIRTRLEGLTRQLMKTQI